MSSPEKLNRIGVPGPAGGELAPGSPGNSTLAGNQCVISAGSVIARHTLSGG
jgi:hypothetical protein